MSRDDRMASRYRNQNIRQSGFTIVDILIIIVTIILLIILGIWMYYMELEKTNQELDEAYMRLATTLAQSDYVQSGYVDTRYYSFDLGVYFDKTQVMGKDSEVAGDIKSVMITSGFPKDSNKFIGATGNFRGICKQYKGRTILVKIESNNSIKADWINPSIEV